MKRFVLISTMALVAAGAWAQDLKTFQTGFETFAADMAPTLSYNATVGNNWSDAYIGNFPHLGVGVAVGFTSVPLASIEPLLATIASGIALPEIVRSMGLPIPAAALAAKIGGFILPFDIGLKGMMLPETVTAGLSSMGFNFDYTLIGGNIRYAVIKENLLLPDVSVGVGYNRLAGSISMPLGVTGQSFTFTTPAPDSQSHTLAVTDPALALQWATDSFDFTAQVSKKILFIEPYVGAGLSLGNSSVKGGIESALTYDGAPVTDAQVAAIKEQLALAGITVPDLSAAGFLFGAESAAPVFRVYGGLTLSLFVVKLDTSVTYVPQTNSLGAQAMVRVQL
ncbi:MAG: hypothetical protein KKA67_12985 [Spirochaetes bacterium]|nr:hypothetical protein [Spirochaetota bacterium]MBU1081660.1 hypothetical protein [Spirochaetota bacterium]